MDNVNIRNHNMIYEFIGYKLQKAFHSIFPALKVWNMKNQKVANNNPHVLLGWVLFPTHNIAYQNGDIK